MEEVYIVIREDAYGSRDIINVFKTLELSEKCVAELSKDESGYVGCSYFADNWQVFDKSEEDIIKEINRNVNIN